MITKMNGGQRWPERGAVDRSVKDGQREVEKGDRREEWRTAEVSRRGSWRWSD